MGMNLISKNLMDFAGGKVNTVFKKMSKNPIVGVGLGAGATVLLESSSAATVILVGLVNSGIVTLIQATAIIMGTNIGATFTVLLISMNTLPVGAFLAVFTLIGAALVLGTKKERTRLIGYIIAGVGMIFVGMSQMSASVHLLKSSDWMQHALLSISHPVLLVLLGLSFSAVVQSSSAVSGIVIALTEGGLMPAIATFYVILGSNIGTCVTAMLASIGGNLNGKRTAFIHVLFNVTGAMLFYPLLRIFGRSVLAFLNGKFSNAVLVAYFHVLFNGVTTVVTLPFIKFIVKVSEKVLPECKTAFSAKTVKKKTKEKKPGIPI